MAEDMMKEEVLMEVEAVESVYGGDCIVLETFPPHLRIHINPRTADVHSQQFVEATIEIRATAQYPSDPPSVDIIGSKGLDEERLKHLSASLHEKTRELSSCLMLVALCEEAFETLSSMNHPEGDCPLCLYPLVPEGEDNRSLPFMKLMSCFHCFHCECIIRWLKWIQQQNEVGSGTTTVVSSAIAEENEHVSEICEMMGGSTGNCPVCRKVFLAKDIEHVLNLVDSHNVNMDDEFKELSEKLLQCDSEKTRRQKYEEILESQQQCGGLIEPPKDNILFSRLSLQELVEEPTNEEPIEQKQQQEEDQTTPSEEIGSSDHNQTLEPTSQRHTQPRSGGSRGRSRGGGYRRNSGARKHGSSSSSSSTNSSRRGGNSRPQTMHWTKKE